MEEAVISAIMEERGRPPPLVPALPCCLVRFCWGLATSGLAALNFYLIIGFRR